MKPLVLKQNDYGLRVFCPKCNNKWNHDKLFKCKHFSHQKYKQYVYHNGKARVQTIDTRDFDEALVAAIGFKNNVKNGVNEYPVDEVGYPIEELSIYDSAERYIQYKNGEGVYEFEKKNLDRDYLYSMKQYLQQFIDVLRNELNVNVESYMMSKLSRKHVNAWWGFIQKRYTNEWSQHAALRALRGWVNHAIDYQEIVMRNPFKDVKMSVPTTKIVTITKREFDKLCKAIDTASPYAEVGVKRRVKKNRYKPYLLDSFKLALFTGLRREELVSLRWNNIYFEENTGGYILSTENLKVQRILGKAYKPKFVPVYGQLEELLLKLGWDKNGTSSKFILFPERKVKEQTIMDALTKGFGHYYNQAFPESSRKKFKCLRKTYLTYLKKYVGDDSIELSSHGDDSVLERHYVNPAIVAKGYNMKIFN